MSGRGVSVPPSRSFVEDAAAPPLVREKRKYTKWKQLNLSREQHIQDRSTMGVSRNLNNTSSNNTPANNNDNNNVSSTNHFLASAADSAPVVPASDLPMLPSFAECPVGLLEQEELQRLLERREALEALLAAADARVYALESKFLSSCIRVGGSLFSDGCGLAAAAAPRRHCTNSRNGRSSSSSLSLKRGGGGGQNSSTTAMTDSGDLLSHEVGATRSFSSSSACDNSPLPSHTTPVVNGLEKIITTSQRNKGSFSSPLVLGTSDGGAPVKEQQRHPPLFPGSSSSNSVATSKGGGGGGGQGGRGYHARRHSFTPPERFFSSSSFGAVGRAEQLLYQTHSTSSSSSHCGSASLSFAGAYAAEALPYYHFYVTPPPPVLSPPSESLVSGGKNATGVSRANRAGEHAGGGGGVWEGTAGRMKGLGGTAAGGVAGMQSHASYASINNAIDGTMNSNNSSGSGANPLSKALWGLHGLVPATPTPPGLSSSTPASAGTTTVTSTPNLLVQDNKSMMSSGGGVVANISETTGKRRYTKRSRS